MSEEKPEPRPRPRPKPGPMGVGRVLDLGPGLGQGLGLSLRGDDAARALGPGRRADPPPQQQGFLCPKGI